MKNLIISIIILFSLMSSGCLKNGENDNSSTNDNNLRIEIRNYADIELNVSITITGNNNTVDNKIFLLNRTTQEGYWQDYYLKLDPGDYIIQIYIDEIRNLEMEFIVYDIMTNLDFYVNETNIGTLEGST